MVRIDDVYQKVLAFTNKEQRGYITPQEFNLFANQAQLEIFEQYFYDLNQFLNGISLHEDPELDFQEDKYVVIREGKRRVKYFFADPQVIVSPPEKEISLPSQDVCFQLEHSQYDKIKKAAAVYQLEDLSAIGEAGVIRLVVRDKRNVTSNEYSIIVGETDKEFNGCQCH